MINIFIATIPQPFDIQGAAESFKNSFCGEQNAEYLQNILKKSSEAARSQSLCALLLLASGLSHLQISTDGLVLAKSQTGKPFFENSDNLRFSISHDESCVAVAISDTPIGIDIQSQAKNQEKIAKRFFAPLEYEKILNGDEDFLTLWTKKEALTKLLDSDFASCAKIPLPNDVFFHTFAYGSALVSSASKQNIIPKIIKIDQF
ncbi:MAG: 4'-phosphopantetheinyl transferase superfamily protein [Ruminococcaceae bacterium]|nr:4'-phosphopantetheinyl transferase superfamily protein [Oscillospiraceae bacterium]